jgi:hypothetical protein
MCFLVAMTRGRSERVCTTQATQISIVKALYDYDANAPGELSIKEDDVLRVFSKEDEWLLVQTDKAGGKAGFVPANYVEEVMIHYQFILTRVFINTTLRLLQARRMVRPLPP